MTFRDLMSNLILLPISKMYGLGVYVRNKMFDWHLIKQHKFDVPVVVVGNIAVGGTGKTPHVEFIIDKLCHSYHIGVLSRGYRRQTKGFVIATSKSTPMDIGDEAYQVYQKFRKSHVVVAVCEDRVAGINEMLRIDPNINLILLDDAFQHRYVKPTASIILTEHSRPIYQDSLLPYGRLRESIHSLSRASMVVVTKCRDSIMPIDFNIISKNLNLPVWQSLYFTKFNYGPLQPVFPEECITAPPYLDWLTKQDMVLAVAGIDNPRPFVKFIKKYTRVRVNVFPDHHYFTRKDMSLIKQRFETIKAETKFIITTEKDAVRLSANPYFPHELKQYIFYLPIEVQFLRNQNDDFINDLRRLIAQHNK